MRKFLLAVGVSLLSIAANAHAHFTILAPPPASNTADGKGAPPCGPTAPSNVVTPVQGGHAITLKVNETVQHPGFYRVALSINSRSELPADNVVKDSNGGILSPTGVPAGTSATAEYSTDPKFPVLIDHLWDHPGTAPMTFQTEVMLPNVTCDKCTLQVIEFMAQHGPNGNAGYFYHNCVDLKITADPALPPFNPNGGAGSGGAGSGGASNGGATGANSAGAAGAAVGGSGGTSGAGGVPPASAGAATAGAPTIAGASSAGANAGAGAPTSASGSPSVAPADPGDSGGCSLSHRAVGSLPALSLLLGLFALGRRRNRRG